MWKQKLGSFARALGRRLVDLAVADLAIAAVAGAVCWFAGWRTLEAFGASLLASGVIVMIFAALSASGSAGFLSNPAYMLARSVESKPLIERLSEDVEHMRNGFNFLSAASVVSLSLLLLGGLVIKLAN